VLHHRHQLDVREAELGDVVDERLRELSPALAEPPRAGVHLVDRERLSERVAAAAAPEPLVVAPHVGGAVDDRGGLRRSLRAERVRVRLPPFDPVGAADRVLVRVPLARLRHDAFPDPRRADGLERVDCAVPTVPVPGHVDVARVGGPDREADAFVVDVRAESLVEPLVAPFADEMEVELPQSSGCRPPAAHSPASSSLTSPATGIETQSGRLPSS
jgi:hypothetical protein